MRTKWYWVFFALRISSLAVLSVFSVSCDQNGMEYYPYQEEFEEYLDKLQVELKTDEVLLLPLDSCGLCVDQILDELAQTEKVLTVILSGGVVPKDRLAKVNQLLPKENLQIIVDEQNLSNRYDLNAFSPISIDVSQKEYSYVSLSPQNSAQFILD